MLRQSAKALCLLFSVAAFSAAIVSASDVSEPIAPETKDVDRTLSFDVANAVGLAMTAFFVCIAAGGGIGGGGVLVPTFIFVFGFEPKVAIPLSTITIFGSSVTNCILNAQKRHPLANRPLIDWDIMLVMEPLTIAGTVLGSFMNVILPPWILCVMLVILLTATTFKTLKKGIRMFKKESKDMDVTQFPVLLENDQLKACEEKGNGKLMPVRSDADEEELEQILKNESVHSKAKIAAMIVLTAGVLGLSILKGGHSINPFDVVCGEWAYWVISLSVVPFVLIISIAARRYLVSVYHQKEKVSYEYVDGDVEWTERNTIVYPLICSIAGLCAGLFGIGGGIVKGPLMLEMGVSPKVASATSATMILLTSSAAAVSYLLFNSLNVNYAPILFVTGTVFTLVGQKALNHLVQKYNRSSLIILVIGVTVAASAIAMTISSGSSILHLLQGHSDAPGSLCG